jgi:glycosyltransferase involved in cell wall biosynthesis
LTGRDRLRILQLIGDPGPFAYPYFRLIGERIDRGRFDLLFGSLAGRGALQAEAREMGFAGFSLDAEDRAAWPRAVGRLARLLRRERIDILHAHSLDSSLVGLSAARLSEVFGIVTAHSPHETPLHDRKLLTAVDRLCLARLAQHVIAPSRDMKATLREYHRVPRRKLTLIEHGLDLARFDPDRVTGEGVRDELGLTDRLVLATLGRLYWIKNQPALVRAFAKVVVEHPEAVLLIVGSGDAGPVERERERLGLADRVVISPARHDLPDVLAAVDIMVHPALAESFGLVIVEAMAMGKPVVSTPVGIASELLRDGTAGVLAQGGDDAALEGALREALGQREHWPEMGAAGRQLARRFPARRMVERYERLYLSVAERASAGRP